MGEAFSEETPNAYNVWIDWRQSKIDAWSTFIWRTEFRRHLNDERLNIDMIKSTTK